MVLAVADEGRDLSLTAAERVEPQVLRVGHPAGREHDHDEQ
jgi:hypothetical protein